MSQTSPAAVKGTLISSLNHPVSLRYDGKYLYLAPHGRIPNVEKRLLGDCPTGVRFVPIRKAPVN